MDRASFLALLEDAAREVRAADQGTLAATLLGTVAAPSALSVGGSYTSSLTADVPNGTSGNYYVIVVTDAAGAVNEGAGGKANNTAVSSVLPITLAPLNIRE